MLSFNKEGNRLIAIMSDDKGRSKDIYLRESFDKFEKPDIDTDDSKKMKIFEEFLDLQKKLSDDDISKLLKAYRGGEKLEDGRLKTILKHGLQFVDDSLKTYLSFPKTIDVLPKFGKSEAFSMYLSGASGAGKSHLICELIHNNMPPRDAGVFYFGPYSDDPSFKKISKHIIPVDLEKFRDEFKRDIEVGDFPDGSVIIWDDIESLPNAKEVEMLRDKILSVFRHHGLKMFCVNHVGMAGHKTKKLLLESKYLAVYPSSNWKQVENMLKTYMGLDKEKCVLIKKQPSRWVILCKHFPSYALSQHGVMILN